MTIDLSSLLVRARQHHRAGGGSVLDVLLRSAGVGPKALGDALRAQAGVEALFDETEATPDLQALSRPLAPELGAVPLVLVADGSPRLGMLDPWDDARVERVGALMPGGLPPLVALPGALLQRWLGGGEGAAPSRPSMGASAAVATGPVVGFVDDAIRSAYHGGASDIHFECDRQGVTVRLRKDGVMVRLARMDDPRRAEEVISRVKVLAQLDITERRTPQDGRFRTQVAGDTIDLRVSIMPSVFGEDAVLRLLDKANLRARDTAITLTCWASTRAASDASAISRNCRTACC